MSTSDPPEDTSKLVERLDRGDLTVVDALLGRHYERMLAMAREERRRYRVSEAEYGDDDAVNDVFLTICRLVNTRNLAPAKTRMGFWKRIRAMLKSKVRLASDRLRRKKRGGNEDASTNTRALPPSHKVQPATGREGRIVSLFQALDQIVAPLPPAEKWVQDEDELRHLLKCLAGEKERRILVLTLEGYSQEEIARRLGVATITVRRKLVLIRQTMEALNFGR